MLRNGGTLVVVQRPPKAVDITEKLHLYVSCKDCLGFYARAEMWRHSCPAVPKENAPRRKIELETIFVHHSKELSLFFSRLKRDSVANIAKSDPNLMKMISCLVLNKGMSKFRTISEKIRILCSFLQHTRNMVNQSLTFSDLMTPEKFDLVKESLIDMFRYNVSGTQTTTEVTMDRPSSLKRLGQSLTFLCKVVQMDACKKRNYDLAKEVKVFSQMCDHEILPLMANAHSVMKCSQSGKPQDLPQKEDMLKLKTFMTEILEKTNRNAENMRFLKEVTLAYLIMYNKRRSSEVAKLTTDVWNERHAWKKSAREDEKKFSKTEVELLESFEMVYIKGKRNRFVPILFPKETVGVVNWLSECHRHFIFENNGGNFIRGHDAIRKVASAAGVFNSNITSTNYRKLAATTLQVRNYNLQ